LTLGTVVVEKLGLVVADGAGVLPDIADGVDAGGEFGKLLGIDCLQVTGGYPCGLGNLFQGDAYPFPYRSQTKARAGMLPSQVLSSGRHE